MTAPAIVMLIVSTLLLWGGLISAIVALSHVKSPKPEDPMETLSHRDL